MLPASWAALEESLPLLILASRFLVPSDGSTKQQDGISIFSSLCTLEFVFLPLHGEHLPTDPVLWSAYGAGNTVLDVL